jgi:hypothetical protein
VQFRLRLKTVLLNGTICGRQPTLEQPANELALISGNRDFQPEQLLNFIELRPFTKRWAELGLDAEDDLTALQLIIMGSPKAGAVIKGTRGLRKLRFAPPRWHSGKSGAARILYVYFETHGIVLLCLAFRKNEADDISEAVKSHLNDRIDEIEVELRRRLRRTTARRPE